MNKCRYVRCEEPAVTKNHCKKHREEANKRSKKYQSKIATPEIGMRPIGVFK